VYKTRQVMRLEYSMVFRIWPEIYCARVATSNTKRPMEGLENPGERCGGVYPWKCREGKTIQKWGLKKSIEKKLWGALMVGFADGLTAVPDSLTATGCSPALALFSFASANNWLSSRAAALLLPHPMADLRPWQGKHKAYCPLSIRRRKSVKCRQPVPLRIACRTFGVHVYYTHLWCGL
jgi:hypothetical protein